MQELEYFRRGSMSEQKIVNGYRPLAGEFWVINGEFCDLQCLMNTLYFQSGFIQMFISEDRFNHVIIRHISRVPFSHKPTVHNLYTVWLFQFFYHCIFVQSGGRLYGIRHVSGIPFYSAGLSGIISNLPKEKQSGITLFNLSLCLLHEVLHVKDYVRELKA